MEHPARAFPLNAPARTEAGVPAEVRYRMLVEQIPAVTYIADFTADAPFLYVSPQIEQLLGFPVDRWIENDDLWSERIHPDDRERVLAAERLTYEQAIPYEGEFRMLAADGRVVWIWERDTIIRDSEGRPVCTQGVLVDVTELKRTQSALQESEALVREERDRAQGYLDIAATMIVVLAADGTISLVNRRACAGAGPRRGRSARAATGSRSRCRRPSASPPGAGSTRSSAARSRASRSSRAPCWPPRARSA